MSIVQALIISVWVALIQARFFGYTGLNLRFSPLMTSLFVGIVLGDVTQGVAVGAAIQLISMGQIAPGGQMATEPAVSGAVATSVAILGNLDPAAAVAIAVPVGILGSYLYTFKIIVNSFVTKYIDKVVDNLEDNKFTFAMGIVPTLLTMLTHVPVMFIALYFGADSIAQVVTSLQDTIAFHILDVIAGSLAAVGIAVLIRIIGEKTDLIFFFIAFFFAIMLKDLNITMVTWAVVGILIAGLYTLIIYKAEEMVKNAE
ncbi:PTS sugar transporter subunit IIC [Enterococcus sp. LJL120]